METRKLRDLAVVALVVLAVLIAFAVFSKAHAATSFSTPSPFKQGGTGNTQIIPAFPTWSVNIPLSPPTNFAAASSTSPGGSLSTSTAPLYFQVVAINSAGPTTVS